MIEILKDKIELIRMLIDHTPIAYVILDRSYRIHYINKSFAQLRKLDMSTTIGNTCYNLSNGGVRCARCAVAQTLQSGKPAFLTRKDVLQEGTIRFIDDYSIPLQFDASGEVEFVLEIMIDRTKEMLGREQRNRDYDETLATLATLLEAKDSYTAMHSSNVRKLSFNLAMAMQLPMEEVFEISVAASLHDIGKVKIPDSIINKAGKLSEPEYQTMKEHPSASYEILEGLTSFRKIRDIARHHHERVDGGGYPDGLVGDEISIGAKIVAVADTYDAMTTTRSYRKSLSHEYAMQELKRVAGKQLDEAVVDAFLQMDFHHMLEAVYDAPVKSTQRQIERTITQTAMEAQALDEMKQLSAIDMENLLSAIFSSTPCGYLLMDATQNILFSSAYLLEYFECTEEAILQQTWSELIGLEGTEECAIAMCQAEKRVCAERQAVLLHSRHKIFDVSGVPLLDEQGEVVHIIGVVIDRTAEVMQKQERERDFATLIEMLAKVFAYKKEKVDEEKLTPQIRALQTRLEALMHLQDPGM